MVIRKKLRNKIARAYQSGLSSYEVAEKFGVTARTVLKIAREYGIEIGSIGRQETISENERHRIAKAYQRGLSSIEVGGKFGIAPFTVIKIARDYGIKIRTKGLQSKFSKSEKRKILKLFNNGLSSYKIAEMYGVNQSTISRIVQKYQK